MILENSYSFVCLPTNEFMIFSALGRTSTETLRVHCRLQLKRRAWNSHNSHSTVEHGFLNVTHCSWESLSQTKLQCGEYLSVSGCCIDFSSVFFLFPKETWVQSVNSVPDSGAVLWWPAATKCYLWCILTKTYLFDCLSSQLCSSHKTFWVKFQDSLKLLFILRPSAFLCQICHKWPGWAVCCDNYIGGFRVFIAAHVERPSTAC